MPDRFPAQQADRTQLQQIIVGLTEGIIIINPDQTIAWANHAALEMHGIKQVKDLGSSVSDYRSRYELRYRNQHKLPPGTSPMDRLVAGEAISQVTVEVGRPGDDRRWVHQIRSLVLSDANGNPDCLVMVIEDETERYNAEERFEKTFAANPAPAIILRLSDMRYVKVNQGFLEMTGYLREALIGRSVHEFDILAGAEKRELAVERLHTGTTVPQMEACLQIAEGKTKTVIVAGQPIEVGDAACMLFSFADLHPRKQAEDALRQSEIRFAAAFRMAPGPMAIVALDGMRVLDVNDAFTKATGWRLEEVIGRSEIDVGLWGDGPARVEIMRLVSETGQARSVDVHLKAKDGHAGDYLLSVETVTIHDEPCILNVMLDITARKQTEATLLAAVDAVMQDASWLGQKIVEKVAGLNTARTTAKTEPAIEDLTSRPREVLALMAKGLSDDDIARRLAVSRNTIRNHISVIYRTVGMHRRSAVIVWARERGLGLEQHGSLKQRAKRTKKSN